MEILKLLKKERVPFNMRIDDAFTSSPLSAAAAYGTPDTVKMILKHPRFDPQINFAIPNTTRSPLTHAARSGNVEVFPFLSYSLLTHLPYR